MAKKFLFYKKQILEIQDIKETVKALEKIAAANIHFLKLNVMALKDYELRLKRIFSNLPSEQIPSTLMRKTPKSGVLKVILTVEKGFCGSLLNDLLDFVKNNLKKEDKVLVVGEKGRRLCRERKIRVDYFFPSPEVIPQEEQTREIKKFIFSQYLSKKIGQVIIFYPHFKSLFQQEPTSFPLLPFNKKEIQEKFGEIEPALSIYEPSQKEVLDFLVREYLEIVFYQKVLETKLSELAAKTVAMEQAGERAEKVVKNLWYQYFREKRETITKEITDLASHRVLVK